MLFCNCTLDWSRTWKARNLATAIFSQWARARNCMTYPLCFGSHWFENAHHHALMLYHLRNARCHNIPLLTLYAMTWIALLSLFCCRWQIWNWIENKKPTSYGLCILAFAVCRPVINWVISRLCIIFGECLRSWMVNTCWWFFLPLAICIVFCMKR